MYAAFLLLAAAAPPPPAPPPASAALAQEIRLAAIGDRLVRGGLCAGWTSNPGMVLLDAAQYPPELRAAARAELGLGEGPTVVAVLPGSAAAAAGLAPGDEVRAVDGAALPEPGRGKSFVRLGAAEDLIEQGLADGRGVTLRIGRGGGERDVHVASTAGCPSRFQIFGTRLNATANGRYVQVSPALMQFATSDDELAVIVAHELAHNILRHKKKLDAAGVSRGILAGFGKNRSRIRETELDADRWALYLMARAGYDIAVAPAFWERLGRKTDPILSDGTHAGWRERVARAQDEIARIEAMRRAGEQILP